MRARRLSPAVLVLATVMSTTAAAAATTAPPKIISVSGIGRESWLGGTKVIQVQTSGATSCHMTLRNEHPYVTVRFHTAPFPCAVGTKVRLGENTIPGKAPVVFVLSATGPGGVATRAVEILMSSPPARSGTLTTSPKAAVPVPTTTSTSTTTSTTLAPPVKNLDACTAGPNCFYGPIFSSYQTYGNTAPDLLGDCTFAAAANWEQVVLGDHPDTTLIGYEFAEAGGTADGGLTQASLWTYWQQYGIAGVYLTGLHSYFTDQTDVQNGVRSYGAMIVELQFVAGTYFGNLQISTPGYHDVVVDGFTPEGPLVVSWGETFQMTWQQWSDEVVGMWGIGVSS